MSILKMVNEKDTDKKRIYAKDDYLTALSKTDNGKLVGSTNCMSRYVVDEMLAVKRIFHKSRGRNWVEVVVSPTPDNKARPNEEYLEVARAIVKLYSDFQCRYAVHLDTHHRHIHLMLNTVSVRDGHKYTQSPSGLQRMKQQVNDILLQHNFDIIKMSADEMLDLTDHSEDESFDYLEIEIENHEIEERSDTIDVLAQGIDFRESLPVSAEYSVYDRAEEKRWLDFMENEQMLKQWLAQNAVSASLTTPEQSSGYLQQQTRPTIAVDVAPHYSVNVNGADISDETLAALRGLGQTSPEQLNAGANMAMALHNAAVTKGFDVNIAVSAAPTIEINLNESIQPDEKAITIDADYRIEA